MNTRRKVLKASSSALALGAFGLSNGIQIVRAQPASGTNSRLVVIFLRGAMDGLSFLPPIGDPNYYKVRSTTAIAKPGETDGAIELNSLFGLHPAAAALMPYWQNGQLAFVPASGSTDKTRSHFDAQDYMETATPGRKSTPDGWMNRLAASLIANNGGQSARLQAVSLGPTTPRIFAGEVTVSALASGRASTAKGALENPAVAAALKSIYAGSDRVSEAVHEATAARQDIMNSLRSDDPSADRDALSLAGLNGDVARLAQLMQKDARVRLAFVPVGGWDTHANQGAGRGQLANRFQLLTQAMDTLAKGLGSEFQHTTVLVISEFGRTVRQNGTGGTDHGHGNVAMLLGGGVRGGKIYGQFPGLDSQALHENRDVAITTDFRQIIAEIAQQRFSLRDNQLSNVLPGFQGANRLGLYS